MTWNRWQQSTTRGQSTLEYILIIAAVLVAVIVAANGVIKTKVGTVMGDAGTVIENSTKKLKGSLGLNTPAASGQPPG